MPLALAASPCDLCGFILTRLPFFLTAQGDTIASCDADGIVKMWDVRMVAERATVEAGAHPVNTVSFDRSGTVVAAASDDGTIKILDTEEATVKGVLQGHDDAVQTARFDPNGKYLISGASDCSFRVWS